MTAESIQPPYGANGAQPPGGVDTMAGTTTAGAGHPQGITELAGRLDSLAEQKRDALSRGESMSNQARLEHLAERVRRQPEKALLVAAIAGASLAGLYKLLQSRRRER